MKNETKKFKVTVERPDAETQELVGNFMLLQFDEDEHNISVKAVGKYSIAQLTAAYTTLGKQLEEEISKLSPQALSELLDNLS